MRATLRLLIALMLVLAAVPAQAIQFSRVLAPVSVDLTPYGPLVVAPFAVRGVDGIEGFALANSVSNAIAAEGFVELAAPSGIGVMDPDDNSVNLAHRGRVAEAGVLLVGNAISYPDERISYRTDRQQVWVDRDVWRDGKQCRERVQEWQDCQVRVIYREVEVTLRAVAIDCVTGDILGRQTVEGRASDSWDDKNTYYGRGTSWLNLNRDAAAGLPELLASAFTPYRVTVDRDWRPRRHAEADIEAAIALADNRQYDQAEQRFTQLLQQHPDQAGDLWGDLVILYDLLGRYDDAEDALESAEASPESGHDLEEYRRDLQLTYSGPEEVVRPAVTLPNEVPTPPADTRPRVVRLSETGQLFISVGSKDGIRVGDLVALTAIDKVADLNGEALGDYRQERGHATITEVFDHFCLATPTIETDPKGLEIGLFAEITPPPPQEPSSDSQF
ncbi:MAG: tetratricopeptide repeat protein [bacterium]